MSVRESTRINSRPSLSRKRTVRTQPFVRCACNGRRQGESIAATRFDALRQGTRTRADDGRNFSGRRAVRFQMNIADCLPGLQAILKPSIDDQVGILIGCRRRAKRGQQKCAATNKDFFMQYLQYILPALSVSYRLLGLSVKSFRAEVSVSRMSFGGGEPPPAPSCHPHNLTQNYPGLHGDPFS